jgi:predicted Fe-S protein YdhL (DUF1289 family)
MHRPIYSPCIRICSVNPQTKFCDGCYRTLPEIAKWTRLTHEERDVILAELPLRKERVLAGQASD